MLFMLYPFPSVYLKLPKNSKVNKYNGIGILSTVIGIINDFEATYKDAVLKFIKGLVENYKNMTEKPRYSEAYVEIIGLLLMMQRDIKLRRMYLTTRDKSDILNEYELIFKLIQYYLDEIAPKEELIKSEYNQIYCPSKTYDEWLEYHIKTEQLQLIDNPISLSPQSTPEKVVKVKKSPFKHISKMCKKIITNLQKKKE